MPGMLKSDKGKTSFGRSGAYMIILGWVGAALVLVCQGKPIPDLPLNVMLLALGIFTGSKGMEVLMEFYGAKNRS